MNIYDMIPGNIYLIGDSLGYDEVECLEHLLVPGIEFPCVKVRFIENNCEDIFFESPDYGGSTYVEPRS